VFTVKWPAVSRVIPAASNSINISILQGTKVWTSQLIAKPATTATFSNLPLGNVTVTATAYPNVDGTGVAQATATMTVNIVANQTIPVTLTLNSTITALIPSVANLDLSIGQSATVTVSAVDAAGDTVLFASKLLWASKAAGTASVDQNGRITGVGAGATTVTATDPESGKAATINVDVEAGLGTQRLYIADFGNNRLVRSDDIFGTNWTTYGAFGSDVGQFNAPTSICVGDDNRIYVTDQFNNRIVRIDDMTGTNWVSLGGPTPGTGVGQFNHPFGIFVTHDNHIYVTDAGNSRVVRMDDMAGTNWVSLGSLGAGTNQFTNPSGLFVTNDNHIYIADHDNNRVIRMDDMAGTNWTVSSGNTLNGPIDVFVGADGRIYIVDQFNTRVLRMEDMKGNLTTIFFKSVPVNPLKDPPHDFLTGPRGISVTSDNILYVADVNGPYGQEVGRIDQIFSPADDTNFWSSLSFGPDGTSLSGPPGIFLHSSP
jgi:streptogramin lyase